MFVMIRTENGGRQTALEDRARDRMFRARDMCPCSGFGPRHLSFELNLKFGF